MLSKTVLILALVFNTSLALAFPKHNPVPGGIALIPIDTTDTTPRAFYNKKATAIINNDQQQSFAMVGLSLRTKPGTKRLELRWPDGRKEIREFTVKAKIYKAQYLTIKNKRKVNPNKQDMERIQKERSRKNRARTFWSDQKVHADFIIPVNGRISSIFGLRRFFNQQPRNPHSGLDFAAPEGTPIKAVAMGKVIEAGDFFFSGNMVYIDHGQGLISLYAHMNRIDIKVGDVIEQGQVIGTVGQTGRVTGAHLHLAIISNQTLVDPVLLLPELNLAKNAEY